MKSVQTALSFSHAEVIFDPRICRECNDLVHTFLCIVSDVGSATLVGIFLVFVPCELSFPFKFSVFPAFHSSFFMLPIFAV